MLPITVTANNMVNSDFIGFGAEWDSASYDACGVTDEDFKVIADRVRWMRLPVVRTMMLLRWCYRDGKEFDWNSREMQLLYRHLDVCQKENITVFLTDWGCESWTKVPGIENMVDPKYSRAIGEYMDYLINTRNYTCIKYFILVNEPNYEVRDFDRWKQGIQMVRDEFQRRGLDKQVAFAGSDESNAQEWHERAVNDLSGLLGAYDVHLYASDAMVRPGKLEDFFRTHWTYVTEHDANAAGKPCIVGEAGMNDFARHPAINDMIDSFGYGLFMADYAVQAVRAGSAAVCAWQLDDNGHEGFAWGMWYNARNGLALRRWYYPWALLARYVPKGSKIYRPDRVNEDWRLLISEFPVEGGASSWTFTIVNRGDAPLETSVQVPGSGKKTLKRFLYSHADCPASREGYPSPHSVEEMDLAQPVRLSCPPRAVTLATSLDW